MATPVVLPQFRPSLSHLTLIKIAVPLWRNLRLVNLELVLNNISNGLPTYLEDNIDPEMVRCFEAQKYLLLMPTPIRNKIVEAVRALHGRVKAWKEGHPKISEKTDRNRSIYWRNDGTIDKIKTARQIVLNSNIDTTTRFKIACKYCFEENIDILWRELEISGKTKSVVASSNAMVSFWVRRMLKSSEVPWTRAIVEYLDCPDRFDTNPNIDCGSFFPLLETEGRKKFFSLLPSSKPDDLRFYLNALTNDELDKMLRSYTVKILRVYFDWPLRCLFAEAVEKIWSYMDEARFCQLMIEILFKPIPGFNSCELFEIVWNKSPDHFKQMARNYGFVSSQIDLCLKEIENRKVMS